MKKIDILIAINDALETTRITLQLFRKLFPKNDIYLYCANSSLKNNEFLNETISTIYRIKSLDYSPKFITGRTGTFNLHLDSIENYLNIMENRNDDDYLLMTYQDHWLLNKDNLKKIIEKTVKEKYDGFNFYNRIYWEHPTVLLGTAFNFMKIKHYKDMVKNREFLKTGDFFESKFYEKYKDLNWYFPSNFSHEQYFYNAISGIGHFHNYKQKKTYINIYENTYKNKLIYKDDNLKNEESGYWRNAVIGKDLETNTALWERYVDEWPIEKKGDICIYEDVTFNKHILKIKEDDLNFQHKKCLEIEKTFHDKQNIENAIKAIGEWFRYRNIKSNLINKEYADIRIKFYENFIDEHMESPLATFPLYIWETAYRGKRGFGRWNTNLENLFNTLVKNTLSSIPSILKYKVLEIKGKKVTLEFEKIDCWECSKFNTLDCPIKQGYEKSKSSCTGFEIEKYEKRKKEK